MKGLVLCAGYAVRLYPLTRDKPKPLLPIGGIPLLERLMDRIINIKELDKIYIVSNHRFANHYYHWLRNYQEKHSAAKKVEIFDDMSTSNEDRLGAIGDIQFVIQNAKIRDDLLILAGDNLIMFDVADFASFGKQKRLAIAVKDLKNKDLASLYGVVTLDKDNKVVDFEEKPPYPKSSLICLGLYCFSSEHLTLIKKYLDEGHNKDAPGYYIQWLYQRVPLYAFTIKGQWFDIGSIDSYNMANEMFGIE